MHIIYSDDGTILQTVRGPAKGAYGKKLDELGHKWVFEPHFRGNIWEHYVVGGKVQPRPVVQEQVNGAVISGLPAPCKARVYFGEMEIANETIEDGDVDLSDMAPGPYRVIVDAPPCVSKTIEVVVA